MKGVILGASSGTTIGSLAGTVGIVVGSVVGAVVGVWLFENETASESKTRKRTQSWAATSKPKLGSLFILFTLLFMMSSNYLFAQQKAKKKSNLTQNKKIKNKNSLERINPLDEDEESDNNSKKNSPEKVGVQNPLFIEIDRHKSKVEAIEVLSGAENIRGFTTIYIRVYSFDYHKAEHIKELKNHANRYLKGDYDSKFVEIWYLSEDFELSIWAELV